MTYGFCTVEPDGAARVEANAELAGMFAFAAVLAGRLRRLPRGIGTERARRMILNGRKRPPRRAGR